MSDIFTDNCPSCGLLFGVSKNVEVMWRKSKKQFYCPNGHPLYWSGETAEEKELKDLREEAKELREKLQVALDDVVKQTKRADELISELEIWRPQKVEKEAV